MALIEFERMRKVYADTVLPAVDDLDLHIHAGEFLTPTFDSLPPDAARGLLAQLNSQRRRGCRLARSATARYRLPVVRYLARGAEVPAPVRRQRERGDASEHLERIGRDDVDTFRRGRERVGEEAEADEVFGAFEI